MIRGLHHVSRTVANLERSLSFYRDLLGLRVVSEEELEGPDLDKVVGLTDARLRVIELSLGGDSLLELIEYQSPKAQALPDNASPADVGANHIALLVDDLAAAYAVLSAAGVRFTTAPSAIGGGPFAGTLTTYCFDPDGLTVELWQPPYPERVSASEASAAHQVPITTGGENA